MTIDVSNPNLAAAFSAHLAENTAAPALVIDDESWSRGDLDELSKKAVALLVQCGVEAGDRVIVQYDTLAEEVALALATARLGGTFLPVPKRLGIREVNYMMERSRARVFVHQGKVPPEGIQPPQGATVVSSGDIRTCGPLEREIVATGQEHVALIGVTSGSTGQPKGVMHTWPSVAWSGERMRRLADIQPGEAIAVTGAGAGAPGFTIFTYTGLASGATLVKPGKWDPQKVLELARDHRCVWSCMVPTMLEMLLQSREKALGNGKLDDIRAVTVGGGVMSPELIRRAREELGVEVLRMYAMAECMVNASMQLTDSVEARDYFDGRPDIERGAELAVFDEDRLQLPAGEVGEVGLKGPSLLVGYLGDPDAKQQLLTPDGFFLSGDLGQITEDGFVKIVGRKKDMIIRGGYNIDPSEVEELIKSHPAVAKVAVVGYADKLYGERACAVIEPFPGKTIDLDELVKHLLAAGLSKEKLPERLECFEELPLSPDGKILKARVREMIDAGALITL